MPRISGMERQNSAGLSDLGRAPDDSVCIETELLTAYEPNTLDLSDRMRRVGPSACGADEFRPAGLDAHHESSSSLRWQ